MILFSSAAIFAYWNFELVTTKLESSPRGQISEKTAEYPHIVISPKFSENGTFRNSDFFA